MVDKHTPGPWYAVGFQVEIEDNDAPDICNCWPAVFGQIDTRPTAEILANARLIAAAPDLLELAKEVCEAIYEERRNCGMVLKLRAAIAKATGSAT